MEIVWLISGVTALAGASTGAWRMAKGGFTALGLELALLLGAAGLCYAISGTKTGGYLPGLLGMLLAILVLIAAAGLFLGGAGCWIMRRLRAVPTPPRALALHWDICYVAAFAVLCVTSAAME